MERGINFRETFTAVLVGADGSGKTTVAKAVSSSSTTPIEYVYMGMNPKANRFALPTSRLSYLMKKRKAERDDSGQVTTGDGDPDLGHVPDQRGPIWAAARLLNRLVEEWVRQLIVWRKRWNGSIVLCDRHFALDFSARRLEPRTSTPRLTDRIHKWLLAHAYPQPDLVIFLDAPAELLFERKGEATLEYLSNRQDYFSRLGEVWPNFAVVDATNQVETVVADVTSVIEEFKARNSQAPHRSRRSH